MHVERIQQSSDLAREFAGATGDYDSLLALVARRLAEAFDAGCLVRLVSADGLTIEGHCAIHHPDPDLLPLFREATEDKPVPVGEGIVGRVAATGKPVFIPVVDEHALSAVPDARRRLLVDRLRLTSIIVVPLSSRGRVIGVAGLSREHSKPPLTEDELHLAQDLAAHAALAIANAQLFQQLRRSDDAHRLLFDASPLPLLVFDVDTLEILAANEAALALYGYEREEFLRTRMSALAHDDHAAVRARTAQLGTAEAVRVRRNYRKDGTPITVEFTSRELVFEGRRARTTVIKDITERAEAERTRALLAAIVASSNDAIISTRLDDVITSWNGGAERLFGYSSEEAVGAPITIIIPEGRRDEERALLERVTAGEGTEHCETVRVRKDGSEIPVSISIAPIFDAAGNIVGASKMARDLTAQRRAAEQLQQIEEQLRQALKMEAIGRLAGGIAHDFNNLLTVILSYCALAIGDLAPDNPARDDVEEIRRAAARAADLTRQLLVFSRRQVIQPRVLDLNEVLTGMDKMLRRILGEDVELTSVAAPDLGRVRADPSNVEQVIMNLVVNARDAMPTGGHLTIETADVELDDDYAKTHVGATAGSYVMLAVTDTGTGMNASTRARIFEPFFTTKAPGKGTGLGLATVFGIAQQCGGSVWVYSEVGKGTTFKVYFPRVDAAADPATPTGDAAALGGTETILLVEDQEQVRDVARAILERQGYRVHVAKDPLSALEFCEDFKEPIALLLTDVVMPQMSGAELAKRVVARRPDIKVLCMSGYTDDSVVRHGVLESGVAFLQKPFTRESLSRKVREVLNAGANRRS